MLRLLTSRLFGKKLDEMPAALAAAASQTIQNTLHEALEHASELEESTLLTTIGWLSAGVGALALGLFVGRELRQRYKFNRRTPYDFYAHAAGDDSPDMEFGVGI